MNTAEILSLVSLLSYIVAGICLVLAILFWFLFKIPAVIGDLSGRTARKSIEKMRATNVQSGNKSYRSSSVNVARGKLTDSMGTQSKKASAKKAAPAKKAVSDDNMAETGLLAENKATGVDTQETELLTQETAPLMEQTAPLMEDTVALDDLEATGMLVDDNATMLLMDEPVRHKRTGGVKITMINEVMLIHTNEVIR